jgi:hypothetical protein
MISLSTYLALRRDRTQHSAHDLDGETTGIGFQAGECLFFGLINAGTSLLDLLMGAGTSLLDGIGTGLQSLLTPEFLIPENFQTSFAQALLVVGGAGFGDSDVGASLFHGSLGTAAALGQNGGQRTVDQEGVNKGEGSQQNHRRNGSEQ